MDVSPSQNSSTHKAFLARSLLSLILATGNLSILSCAVVTTCHLVNNPFPPPNLGSTRMISKYRPQIPILAFTSNLRTARELNVVWGVQSIYSPNIDEGRTIEEKARNAVRKVGYSLYFAANL